LVKTHSSAEVGRIQQGKGGIGERAKLIVNALS